jgi:hypothetical protein
LIDATPTDVTPFDATPTDASVWALQAAMCEMPQYVPETTHYFADGMYCRCAFRHAGVLVVGKVHKKEHFYMVVQGSVAVIQDGAERKVYTAPAIIVSKPGTKRAVLALEDSTCLTVHRTDLTDLAEIEKELIEDDPTALFGPDNLLKALEHKQ